MENLLTRANNATKRTTSVESKKNKQQNGEGGGHDPPNCQKVTTTTTKDSEEEEEHLFKQNNNNNNNNIHFYKDPLQPQQTTKKTSSSVPFVEPRGDSEPHGLSSQNHHYKNEWNGINNNNNNDNDDDPPSSTCSAAAAAAPPSIALTPTQQQAPPKSPELILGVGDLANPTNNSIINTISTLSVSNNNHNHIINTTTASNNNHNNHVSKKNLASNNNNNNKWMGTSTTKRNVTFPEDNRLVSGFSEPCNPWKNAPICTAEELVLAYKKGCELNVVKPCNKIIQQLLGIQNCWERHKTLNLKGEKLDQKHCEALEDIFRRVQFENLELEACHLDDETAAALFDMIEYYDSTMKLNISFNKDIGIRGWQSCSRMIRKTPSLSHLDARGCELNDHIIPVLGRSLKMGSNLTVLHLEYTYLSGRPLVILVAALKVNEILQELFLGDNKLMASDGIQIGTLLKFNHKLQLLDLRNNHLQDVGLSHLCEGFRNKVDISSGLSTLVLWNNQISYQGMPSLSRALSVVECLETLNLGHNNITNEGIHYLKEGLLKNKSLIRLGLQGTKVLCEGAVALAEYIADSSRLLRIDLRENDIRTAGLMALSLALKVNESLVRLELDRNTKKEVAVKDYADQQRRLLQDINNYLDRNQALAIKRENEEKEKQRQAQEEAAAAAAKKQEIEKLLEEQKKEEKEELKEEEEDLESVYIPTCNQIRRPTLLFFPGDPSPQQTLDSPAFIPDNEYLNQFNSQFMSPVSGVSLNTMTTATSPTPGEFLLSPQYCEKTKAKKIFTVTKVGDIVAFQHSPNSGSSRPASSPGLMSPTSPMEQIILNFDQPLSENVYSSPIENGPRDIRNEIAAETVSGLFGILGETETIQTGHMPDYNFENNKSDNEDLSMDKVTREKQTTDETGNTESGSHLGTLLKQETFQSELKTDNKEEKEDTDQKQIPSSSSSSLNNCSRVDNCINAIQSVNQLDTENVIFPDEVKKHDCLSDIEFVNNVNVDKCKKESKTEIGNLNKEDLFAEVGSAVGSPFGENLSVGPESFFPTKCDMELDCSTHYASASMAHSKDQQPLEQSKEISSSSSPSSYGSELSKPANGCCLVSPTIPALEKCCRPEFHTNLSLNGMTQELANVLDSLELEANKCQPEFLQHTFKNIQTDTVTSPAEYEKELDDMLAHVQAYHVKS